MVIGQEGSKIGTFSHARPTTAVDIGPCRIMIDHLLVPAWLSTMGLDKFRFTKAKLHNARKIGELCRGSTADSFSVAQRFDKVIKALREVIAMTQVNA